jgi:hypothetical protein
LTKRLISLVTAGPYRLRGDPRSGQVASS